jgi:hypothetical protein
MRWCWRIFRRRCLCGAGSWFWCGGFCVLCWAWSQPVMATPRLTWDGRPYAAGSGRCAPAPEQARWRAVPGQAGCCHDRLRPSSCLEQDGASPSWKTTVLRCLLLSGLEMSWSAGGRASCVAWWPPTAGVDGLRVVLARVRTILADADPSRSATITLQGTTMGNSRVSHVGRDVPITIRG